MHTTPLSPPIDVVLGDGSSIQASAETAEPNKGDDLPETALITPHSLSQATIDTWDHRFGHLNTGVIFDEGGTDNDAAPLPVNPTSPSPSIKGQQLNVLRSDDGANMPRARPTLFSKTRAATHSHGAPSLGAPSSTDLLRFPATRPGTSPARTPPMRPSGLDDSDS